MKLSKMVMITTILLFGLCTFCYSYDLTGIWDVTTEVPGEDPVTVRTLIIQKGDEFTMNGIPGKIRNEKYLIMAPEIPRSLIKGLWIQIDKITFKPKDENRYSGKTYLSVYDFKNSTRKVFSNDTMQNAVRIVDAPPMIYLTGPKEVWVEKGTGYSDGGAKAYEETGVNISEKMEINTTVDVNKVGDYKVSYNVTGSNGKAADKVVRTVHVVAPAAPALHMKGDAQVSVQKGDGYVDNGATAFDFLNRDITDKIKITVNGKEADPNTIDISKSGAEYEIVYSVTDDHGTAKASRAVTVMQREDEQSFFKYCFISSLMD